MSTGIWLLLRGRQYLNPGQPNPSLCSSPGMISHSLALQCGARPAVPVSPGSLLNGSMEPRSGLETLGGQRASPFVGFTMFFLCRLEQSSPLLGPHISLKMLERVKKNWVKWPGLIPQTPPWFDDCEILPSNKHLQRLEQSRAARRGGIRL